MPDASRAWPIRVRDRSGHSIYITNERWEHALEHPGMSDTLLNQVLSTVRSGQRKQDVFAPNKFFYSKVFAGLPSGFTHVVVVVKFGWRPDNPSTPNNFVLTAYLVGRAQGGTGR